MAFKILILLIHGLAPFLPALLLARTQPDAVITPWPIVGTLLGIDMLLILTAWKRLGYTRRQRETESRMLIVSAFVPLATYYWIFPADMSYSWFKQVLLYGSMQVVWIISVNIAPDWVGRIRQRRAEERALSGKQHFESREEVIRKHREKQLKR